MKVDGKLTVTKTQTIRVTVGHDDVLALVRKTVHIPAGVEVRIFVEVPGGGDWSHTDLDLHEHPVHVEAEWSVDVTDEQG